MQIYRSLGPESKKRVVREQQIKLKMLLGLTSQPSNYRSSFPHVRPNSPAMRLTWELWTWNTEDQVRLRITIPTTSYHQTIRCFSRNRDGTVSVATSCQVDRLSRPLP
jgi:hypothetical protein